MSIVAPDSDTQYDVAIPSDSCSYTVSESALGWGVYMCGIYDICNGSGESEWIR